MSDEHPTYNGRYQVQRRIARGGMAEVFLAQDLLLARPVAVKVLFPEFAGDPAFVARFRREAQAAANLNHPNIVGVYDWGQEGGTYYIVMEYIDGRSLSEILRTQGMPPAKTAAGIAADVAAALGFAHRNGVVHRDVKPGNIMITNGGHVKVADFGIARAMTASAEDNLTQTGSVMGTATYFSPEQAQGHSVDQRSDLYSLGIVMYEMADGKPPFTADSPVAVAYKHVQEAPTSLRQAHPEVPADYEAIVFKLLAKEPDERYPDAESLRADLRRFAEGQSVRARPGTVAAAAGGAALGAAASSGGAGAVPPTGVPVPDPAPTEPPYEQARRSRTGWYVLLLVILLAVLGGLLFAFASLLGIGEESGVTVPDVVNRPVAEAQATLEAVGLRVDLTPAPQPSTEVAAGSVISQDPPGGSTHDAGTVVRLVVSSGQPDEDQAMVPDVEDDLVADARRKLNAAGFTNLAPIIEEESDDVPRGRVISQFPAAGIERELSTEIQLIVSSGPPPSTPPPTQPTSSSSSSTSSSSSSTSSTTTSTSSTTTPTSSSTTSSSTSEPEDPEE